MALPTETNHNVGSVPASVPTILPALTAYVAFSPGVGGVTKTCNLTSDTMIYRADGGIWDDSQGCWISVDITKRLPTPRKPDQDD